MKKFLSLVKTNLNTNFGLSALKYRFAREKKKRLETIGLAIVLGIGPIVVMYTLMMLSVYMVGSSLNAPEMVITVAFIMGQMFVLFFGIFYVMGAFYFSKDLEILIPLPLKPYEVLGSKLVTVMVNEYLTLLPILVPPVVIYGIGMGMGFDYWLKGLALILASPVIPLVIASIFVVLLMRIVNVRKSKDLFAIVGGFFGLALALGINFFTQRLPRGNESDAVRKFLEGQVDIIGEIGRKFPPSIWATFGLTRPGIEGVGYFILFIGVSIILFMLLLWLAERVFYRGLLSGQEVTRKRKVLTAEETERRYTRASSPVTAIFLREWKLLLRTPVYVLNGLSGAIIGPFIIVIMLVAQGQAEETKALFSFVENPDNTLIVTLGGLAFMLVTSGINVVASTAVSREGQNFWIAKMIPVSAKQQVYAKFLQSLCISVISVIMTGIILAVFFKFSVSRVLIIFILGVLGSVLVVALNLIIDVLHPKLEWSSPQEAMKQNMNGLFGMIASFLAIGVLAGAAVILILLKLPELAVYILLLLFIVSLSVPCLIGLFALAERQYRKFEV